jgi:hypothetical protein
MNILTLLVPLVFLSLFDTAEAETITALNMTKVFTDLVISVDIGTPP